MTTLKSSGLQIEKQTDTCPSKPGTSTHSVDRDSKSVDAKLEALSTLSELSVSNLIKENVSSSVSLDDNFVNLTFSFPKSYFGKLSLAVLNEIQGVEFARTEIIPEIKKFLMNPVHSCTADISGERTPRKDNLNGKSAKNSTFVHELEDFAYSVEDVSVNGNGKDSFEVESDQSSNEDTNATVNENGGNHAEQESINRHASGKQNFATVKYKDEYDHEEYTKNGVCPSPRGLLLTDGRVNELLSLKGSHRCIQSTEMTLSLYPMDQEVCGEPIAPEALEKDQAIVERNVNSSSKAKPLTKSMAIEDDAGQVQGENQLVEESEHISWNEVIPCSKIEFLPTEEIRLTKKAEGIKYFQLKSLEDLVIVKVISMGRCLTIEAAKKIIPKVAGNGMMAPESAATSLANRMKELYFNDSIQDGSDCEQDSVNIHDASHYDHKSNFESDYSTKSNLGSTKTKEGFDKGTLPFNDSFPHKDTEVPSKTAQLGCLKTQYFDSSESNGVEGSDADIESCEADDSQAGDQTLGGGSSEADLESENDSDIGVTASNGTSEAVVKVPTVGYDSGITENVHNALDQIDVAKKREKYSEENVQVQFVSSLTNNVRKRPSDQDVHSQDNELINEACQHDGVELSEAEVDQCINQKSLASCSCDHAICENTSDIQTGNEYSNAAEVDMQKWEFSKINFDYKEKNLSEAVNNSQRDGLSEAENIPKGLKENDKSTAQEKDFSQIKVYPGTIVEKSKEKISQLESEEPQKVSVEKPKESLEIDSDSPKREATFKEQIELTKSEGMTGNDVDSPGRESMLEEGVESPERENMPEEGVESPERENMPEEDVESPERENMPEEDVESPERENMPEEDVESSERENMPEEDVESSERENMPEEDVESPERQNMPEEDVESPERETSPADPSVREVRYEDISQECELPEADCDSQDNKFREDIDLQGSNAHPGEISCSKGNRKVSSEKVDPAAAKVSKAEIVDFIHFEIKEKVCNPDVDNGSGDALTGEDRAVIKEVSGKEMKCSLVNQTHVTEELRTSISVAESTALKENESTHFRNLEYLSRETSNFENKTSDVTVLVEAQQLSNVTSPNSSNANESEEENYELYEVSKTRNGRGESSEIKKVALPLNSSNWLVNFEKESETAQSDLSIAKSAVSNGTSREASILKLNLSSCSESDSMTKDDDTSSVDSAASGTVKIRGIRSETKQTKQKAEQIPHKTAKSMENGRKPFGKTSKDQPRKRHDFRLHDEVDAAPTRQRAKPCPKPLTVTFDDEEVCVPKRRGGFSKSHTVEYPASKAKKATFCKSFETADHARVETANCGEVGRTRRTRSQTPDTVKDRIVVGVRSSPRKAARSVLQKSQLMGVKEEAFQTRKDDALLAKDNNPESKVSKSSSAYKLQPRTRRGAKE